MASTINASNSSGIVQTADTSGILQLQSNGTTVATLTSSGVNAGIQVASFAAPAFSAYQSSAQTPSANTYTKIIFQTKEFDTNNNFTSSTFTPTVAGYYQINLTATSTAENLSLVSIYKNGSNYKNVGQTNGTSYGASVSCLIYCNGSTDYIEGYIYITSSTATIANSQYTYINGSLVRSA